MLRTSIRMYNGTDIQRIRGEDYGIFMKSAWDKFMMEVNLKNFFCLQKFHYRSHAVVLTQLLVNFIVAVGIN